MSPSKETLLDFDNTVGTEERFNIRRFLDEFVDWVNAGLIDQYQPVISGAISVDGFSDYTMLKQSYVGMLERKFGQSKFNYMRFPKLKLTFKQSVFWLNGTYEEFVDNILVTEGTIEIFLVKQGESYQFAKIKFFPRMKLQDEFDF